MFVSIEIQGILPVLIGQLLKEQAGSELTLFGMNFAMVSTVAIVRNIDHSSTKITYLLEDHTGQIEAHYWLEEGDMTSNPKVLMNTYAKVYGSVRNSAGTRAIMIFAINSCNINQLTTHLLEVLSARYMAEEFSKNADKPSDAAANGDNRMTGFNAPFNSNGNNSSSAAAAGLTGKQLMVFNAIKTHKSESGISLSELQKNYSHISPGEMS